MSLDTQELAERVARASAAWAHGARVTDVQALPRGSSSATYLAQFVDAPVECVVLKVAFPGVKPVRNRDVLRQARLLRALARVPGVRVPEVLFQDPGAPPEVPPFFAMPFVAGECFEPNLDREDSLPAPRDVEGRALDAARMLAALHAVAPTSIALEGELEVTPADEVERWVKAFDTVEDALRPGYKRCAQRLLESLPPRIPPALIHGDFRLGNMLCKGSEVRAIIDWELWALSDPRIDLAWFLVTADPTRYPPAVRDCPGMPRSETLLAAYEDAIGTRVRDLEWFSALILFKMGATSALIIKHQRKRGVAPELSSPLAGKIGGMLEDARALLS